jgi:hypothetical protein
VRTIPFCTEKEEPLLSTRKLPWILPSLCAGAALYLYLNLFVHARVPILLSGDQLYFWMDAQRILHGELPYRDFFQFTPPGTDLVYFLPFKLFGPYLWVTNLVVLVLGVAVCGICFSIATEVMELDLALAATLLFLTLIYTRLLNGTHHWFSVLAILAAVRVLLPAQSRARIFAAGSLLGLGCFFTQSHAGAGLFAVALWLVWKQFRAGEKWASRLADLSLLLLGFAVTLGSAESYLIVAVGWSRLWYFQVTYVLHYMVGDTGSGFLGMPPWIGWRHLPSRVQYFTVYLLLPVVYGLALLKCCARKSEASSPEQLAKVMLIALTGSILLGEVIFSLNWLRIYTISMPGIILLLWLLGRSGVRRAGVRIVWAAILFIAATEIFHAQHGYVVAELPAGRAAMEPRDAEKLLWIRDHTQPEEFFFDSAWPGVYLPLRLRNPIFAEGVGLDIETRPEFVQEGMAQLDRKKVRYILWSPQLSLRDNHEPATSSLAPLRVYLHQHYRKVKVFADQDEIWERE